tara:strand:- start:4357 stop:4812 length:456 start_codon:yes stop_codon:yes gene_type:complete
MLFTKKDLIYFIAFFLIIVYFNSKTEKMSNTDITKKIQEVYKIDVNAIRNLSKLANDLTNNGKLVVPGGLEIAGNVTINKELNVKGGGNVMKTNERNNYMKTNERNNYMKPNSNYFIYQVNGHYGGKYLHGHNNGRVGTAATQYRSTFKFV